MAVETDCSLDSRAETNVAYSSLPGGGGDDGQESMTRKYNKSLRVQCYNPVWCLPFIVISNGFWMNFIIIYRMDKQQGPTV